MRPEHLAVVGDDRPAAVDTGVDRGELLGEPAAGVAVADEADVVAVRLGSHREPTALGLAPDLGLGGVTQRKHRVGQLLLGEHAEHVALVLAHVLGAVHLDQPVGVGAQLGVVAGHHRVEAQRDGPVEHGSELDLLVAAQAGVGRASLGVLAEEVLDDVLVEALAQVPDVERDADHVGGPAGVVGVLDRAASARAGPVGLRVARERQVDAGDVVALLRRARGGDGRVHAARHRCQDSHQTLFPAGVLVASPALRARSTTGRDGLDQGVDVRLRRAVAEGEPQRGARELLRGAHRQENVRGLRDARVAGGAGRALDAPRVEQHQQRVALAARELEVGVAGEAVLRARAPGRRCRSRRAPRGVRRPRARHADPESLVASSGWRSTATWQATANPAIAGGSIVPERMSRSWPPPWSRAVGLSSRRTTSAPTP